jgi:hypothetical protein
MIIGISQPTFLPWCGYMALIDEVDEFVFLDDVQFERRSWHQRNYIKVMDNKYLLSIPVISKGKRFQKINETMINYEKDLINKIIFMLTQSYSKSPYFDKYSNDIFKIFKNNYKFISELNINLIKFFCKILEINTKIDFSSRLNLSSKGSDLIIDICKLKKCKKYISTIGSKSYLKQKDFVLNNIDLKFYEFEHKLYNQRGPVFLSNLSMLDILLNLGPKTKQYLKENLKL